MTSWGKNGRRSATSAASSPVRWKSNARRSASASSLEASPLVYVSKLLSALADIDLAEICITSNAMATNETPPVGAFTLSDVPRVAVVVEIAPGKKCARSWKILPTVGDDSEYPDVTPRDAQAARAGSAGKDGLADFPGNHSRGSNRSAL